MKKTLKQIIQEDISNLMATQGPQEEAPMTDVSLDEKVDHFLIQYERESVPIAQQYTQENKKFSLKTLMSYLFEAEGDDPLAGGDADAGGDLGGDAGGLDLGGGDTGGEVEKGPSPVPTPKINVSSFAKNIARLVNDYQSLIDPKRIILNRSRAYLEKNYNPEIAKQLMEILDTEYNLSPESFDKQQDDIESPIAIGALNPIGGTGAA